MSLLNKQAGSSGVLGRIKQEATVIYDKCLPVKRLPSRINLQYDLTVLENDVSRPACAIISNSLHR